MYTCDYPTHTPLCIIKYMYAIDRTM